MLKKSGFLLFLILSYDYNLIGGYDYNLIVIMI